MISIAIPSRNEVFLNKTIQDVLNKSKGEIEVFPVLDGWEPTELIEDPRVRYIRIPLGDGATHKRHAINKMVEEASGKFVMSVDAHCMFDEGFDVVLERDCPDNAVMIPRRHRLDAENWCLQPQSDNRPPIDYEYTMWPLKFDRPALHGFKWDERTLARWDIPIDDTMHFQGSCWIMNKDYFKHVGLMQVEGYTGWGQEAEEISFKVRRDGGRVLTNKNTWYAHLHKGPKYGRMYYMSVRSMRECNEYAYNYWVHQHKDLFISYIEKFWPLPTWPAKWKDLLWQETKR